ncbi:hypothetical protein Pmani_016301, partial [Petrolisthes manimaculis]
YVVTPSPIVCGCLRGYQLWCRQPLGSEGWLAPVTHQSPRNTTHTPMQFP